MRRILTISSASTAIVVGLVIVLTVIGYAQLKVKSPQVNAFRPVLKTDPAAVARASFNLLRGDLIGTAKSVVKGVEFDLSLQVANSVPLPLYVPRMNHRMLLNGIEVTESVHTPGMWLKPASTGPVVVKIVVPFDRLDDALVGVLVSGGTLDLATESEIGLVVTTVTKRTDVLHYKVVDSVKTVLDKLLRR